MSRRSQDVHPWGEHLRLPRSLGLLTSVTVVPISTSRRGLAAELALGPEHGLKHKSAANFHNVMTIQQQDVGALVATLPSEFLNGACRALNFALGCDDPFLQ